MIQLDPSQSKPERSGNRANGGVTILCKANERGPIGQKLVLPRFEPGKTIWQQPSETELKSYV
jgi:hypothetical protein